MLAGNQYKSQLSKSTHLYMMLVGKSGTGKSKSIKSLYRDVIKELEAAEEQAFDTEYERVRLHNQNRKQEPLPPPILKARYFTSGTREGLEKSMINCPAGIGINFDEGAALFSEADAYKKSDNTAEFWNNNFEGDSTKVARANQDNVRFVKKMSIALIAGMQTERLSKYFNDDTVFSGLVARFLFTGSGHMEYFSSPDELFFHKTLAEWDNLIKFLWIGGKTFTTESMPMDIPITLAAKKVYLRFDHETIEEHNNNVKLNAVDDSMTAYNAKLKRNVSRFMNILALLDNVHDPVIDESVVNRSIILYRYFQNQVGLFFNNLIEGKELNETKNNINCVKFLEKTEPGKKYSSKDLEDISASLALNKKYFLKSFQRGKFKDNFQKISQGEYLRIA